MQNAEQFAPPIPAAVKNAAARADELQKNLITQNAPGEEDPPAVVEGEEGAQPEESSAAPLEEDSQPPAQDAPADAGDDDEKTWKHKFLSMQGRYNSEVPKMREQVKTLSQEISNLNRLLSSVQRPEPAKPKEPAKSLVTPEEVAEYGPELIDLISRAAKEATAPYEAEISDLKGQLKQFGGQIATGARAGMMSSLASAVPNWEEINVSQQFIDWLALPDTYSGAIRHDMLKAAFGRNDSTRVINFFKGFLAEMAAMAPADTQEPGTEVRPKTPLRNLAAPGRAKSTAAPNGGTPAEKPTFTTSQIAQFYTDKGLGKWRGREKEAQQWEAAIFMAQQEGRIR